MGRCLCCCCYRRRRRRWLPACNQNHLRIPPSFHVHIISKKREDIALRQNQIKIKKSKKQTKPDFNWAMNHKSNIYKSSLVVYFALTAEKTWLIYHDCNIERCSVGRKFGLQSSISVSAAVSDACAEGIYYWLLKSLCFLRVPEKTSQRKFVSTE
mgnify:CR=1 FL=1